MTGGLQESDRRVTRGRQEDDKRSEVGAGDRKMTAGAGDSRCR